MDTSALRARQPVWMRAKTPRPMESPHITVRAFVTSWIHAAAGFSPRWSGSFPSRARNVAASHQALQHSEQPLCDEMPLPRRDPIPGVLLQRNTQFVVVEQGVEFVGDEPRIAAAEAVDRTIRLVEQRDRRHRDRNAAAQGGTQRGAGSLRGSACTAALPRRIRRAAPVIGLALGSRSRIPPPPPRRAMPPTRDSVRSRPPTRDGHIRH